ncbi:MAG: 3-phosphoshikimate 1-carboxyvinyltransferase [Rikenellaceae bacterium]
MGRVVLAGTLNGTVTPPPSKSYAQRALATALLSKGESIIGNIEFCDDTRSAMRMIEALGAVVEQIDESTLRVRGGLNPIASGLFVGESGLATRLFTPIASLCDMPICIDGHGSILKRPMTMMFEPLRQAGVTVKDSNGYLPLEVCGPLCGGEIMVDGSVSSQFITGLLLALPLAKSDSTLYVNRAVSLPYLDMTIETARRFGVEISHKDYREFYIAGGQSYTPTEFNIECDWSAASTLLVGGAIAGSVTINNISMLSKQADREICTALVRAGALVESDANTLTVSRRELNAFEFDATQCPDLFPALVALASVADGTSKIKGAERLIHKESNRAATLQAEYAKCGIKIEVEGDVMSVEGGKIQSARVESHNDHRIAMSLAVAALRSDEMIVIDNSDAVSKSYPNYFEDLESLRVKR